MDRLLGSAAAAMGLLLAAAGVAAQDTRAFLDLVVNEVPKGNVLVEIRADDALVPLRTLTEAGLRGFDGRRETLDGELYVSLSSLRPALTFEIDERGLRLRVTADPALLPHTIRTLQIGRPDDVEFRRSRAAFVNYALTAAGHGGYEVFTESGVSLAGSLLQNTTAVTTRGAVRGLTTLTVDDRARIRRWTLGDAFVSGGPLGGEAALAGVGIAREFDIEPYFIKYPTLSLSTPIVTPSVVEVHVNGTLMREVQIEPGRLDLNHFPLTTGRNQTRVVVRDVFGGVREVATTYYLTASALARGVHDYQYSVGVTRREFGRESWQYAEPVAIARHRMGVTDAVTLGGRFEGTRRMFSGGPTLSVRLPAGEVEAAAAISQTGGRTGGAGLASYAFAGRVVSAGASLRLASPHYANVSAVPDRERPVAVAAVFGGVPLAPGVSVTMQHMRSAIRGEPARSRTGFVLSARLHSRVDLVATGESTRDSEGRHVQLTVGLTARLGDRTNAAASVLRERGRTRTVTDVQRALPTGTGLGYRLRLGDDSRYPSGAVQYQSRYGRYELRGDGGSRPGAVSVTASGALVLIGGGVYATRPVRNSFALLRVPGVKGVRGFASNHEIGRTDRGGNLLVPDLLPYYGNVLGISDSDVPLDYSVSRVRMSLAPPFRGGAIALFPVQHTRRIRGTIGIVSGGTARTPVYGEVRIAGQGAPSSPVGANGEFYFENLPAGAHAAVVEDGIGACAFTLVVPDSAETETSLGSLRCVVEER